ncbi:hypothetical protein ACF0H5_013282 [Mactra antiquata]
MKLFIFLSVAICQCFAATTVELLAGDPKYSTLVSLVTKAGLVDAINGGTFTIFAPNNNAFAAIPSADLTALGNDINALTNVLKYHVVQGTVASAAAKNELQLTTLNGQKLRFNVYDHNNAVTVQGCQIVGFDQTASNGIIHELFRVMMPPTGDIVDVVAKSPELSTVLSLVQTAGIASVLRGDALTLFAPTNDAFARLPSSTVDRLTKDTALLTEILEYHVVPHTEYSPGLYEREFLRTADRNHDRIQVHVDSSGVRINSDGRVTKADIGTTNGVIHEIDHVLIPLRYRLTLAVGK